MKSIHTTSTTANSSIQREPHLYKFNRYRVLYLKIHSPHEVAARSYPNIKVGAVLVLLAKELTSKQRIFKRGNFIPPNDSVSDRLLKSLPIYATMCNWSCVRHWTRLVLPPEGCESRIGMTHNRTSE
jgi:hypothetical protein